MVENFQNGDVQSRSLNNSDAGFIDGFTQSAVDAWNNPAAAIGKVGSGLAIGAAIQAGINNAEMMGGRIGLAAKAAKVALVAVPGLIAAGEIATSDKPGETAGHMAFDMGLFLGAAKLGSYADRLPGTSSLLGPRAVSQVPEGLKYSINGDKVNILSRLPEFDTHQVRLANGKGFVFHTTHATVPLRDMPLNIPGKGKIEYGPNSTTLVNSSGRFERELNYGTTSTKVGDDLVYSGDGKSVHTRRVVNGERESIWFQENGHVNVVQGTHQSGRDWNFYPDGSVTMRSLPSGKYRMSFDANGEGVSIFTHGTSRGIAGRVGPRSNYAPLIREETPMLLKDAGAPSVTPLSPELRTALLDAKIALDSLAKS